MKKEERKQIIKILKSGDFTFAFNDSYYGDLINKKVSSYDKYSKQIEKEAVDCFEIEMGNYGDGLVELLIEALGGTLVST